MCEIYESFKIGRLGLFLILSHFSLRVGNGESPYESMGNYKHVFNEEVYNPDEKYKGSHFFEPSVID